MSDLETVSTFSAKVLPYRRVDFYIVADMPDDQKYALVESVRGGVARNEPLPDLAVRVAEEFGLEADVFHDALEIRATVGFWPEGTQAFRESEDRRIREELESGVDSGIPMRRSRDS
jgi:hypothetical protein